MSTPAPKRLEPFAVAGGFRGTLARLSLPELLRELQSVRASGILSLVAGGARKALYVKEGRVVFATSNLPDDRLGERPAPRRQDHRRGVRGSIKAHLAHGRRQGKALVEIGVLTPDDLWRACSSRSARSSSASSSGTEGPFHFEESRPARARSASRSTSTSPGADPRGRPRGSTPAGAVRSRHPEASLVLERAALAEARVSSIRTRPTCCGSWTASAACSRSADESEIGDNETLKAALRASSPRGSLRSRGRKVRALDQDFVPEDGMLSVARVLQPHVPARLRVHGARGRAHRRERAREVPEQGARGEERVLAGVGAAEGRLARRGRRRAQRRSGSPRTRAAARLVDALNELLYAELLAVKRTLGAEHESPSIRDLQARRGERSDRASRSGVRPILAAARPPARRVAPPASPLIAIVGPTAAGKSALALRVARERGGEIVSCDSLQVYRGLDIGSAKPTLDERRREVPHHLLDVVDPREDFSAAEYARLARAAVREIARRGRLPLVVGERGSTCGRCCRGLFEGPPRHARSVAASRRLAARHGEERASTACSPASTREPRRASSCGTACGCVRALEVYLRHRAADRRRAARAGGEPLGAFDVLVLGPRSRIGSAAAGGRATHASGCSREGLVAEVRGAAGGGLPGPTSRPLRAIGYRQAVAVVRGQMSPRRRPRRAIVTETMRYAKRQMTWFRHQEPGIRWFADADEARAAAVEWLDRPISLT